MIQDHHGPAEGNGYPPPDDVQNYELISGQKNLTHITVTFRRKINTCDPNDWTITVTKSAVTHTIEDKISGGYNSDDMGEERSRYPNTHGSRNAQRPLAYYQTDNGVSKIMADSSVTTLEFGVTNVLIPSNKVTLYWCKVIQLPVSTKKQIIAVIKIIH
jgi:hypothetical protein